MSVEYNLLEYIKLEDAAKLTGYHPDRIETLVGEYGHGVRLHSDNGFRYLDRLDLGRLVNYQANGTETKITDRGIKVGRYFTDGKTDPFDTVGEYSDRHVDIKDASGNVIFELDVYAPKSWSDMSLRIVADKYFIKPDKPEWAAKIPNSRGGLISNGKEDSPKQLVGRVSRLFSNWGLTLGYFKTEEEAKIFEDELNYIQINQMAAFNSPVYFNGGIWDMYGIPGSENGGFVRDPVSGEVSKVVGEYKRPQLHACFIAGAADDLESLILHTLTEARLFRSGSGVGQDISDIRSSKEKLSTGGLASGPMSFFGIWDRAAGVIKSGGKSRRAARMTTMLPYHPDIESFIFDKLKEDHKGLILEQNGFSGGFEGDAYKSLLYQNTNLSVRADKNFFEQVRKGGKIQQKAVKSGLVVGERLADELLKMIAFGSWRIGDPAIQYKSVIDEMNTVKNSGMIRSSNPCSEYMFLNNTSCNLNSINLLKFADSKGNLDFEGLSRAFRTMMIAADIANDVGSYPSEEIAKVSPEFRTTGVGYANLGALLMRRGIPYDSNEGRALTAAITALMQGETLKTSAELARGLGPFIHYELNAEPMMGVVKKHMTALDNIGRWPEVYGNKFNLSSVKGLEELIQTARDRFGDAIELGGQYGYRNAQTTVLAPTGTIAFFMNCDTTGIEPGIALRIPKKLSGGGTINLTVNEVPNALYNLGYNEEQVRDISDYIAKHGIVEGAPWLGTKHYPIFDTAFTPGVDGSRTIDFKGHIKMLAAAQPFISGAISKTNNLPRWSSVKEIYDGYLLGDELGIKAVSVFRAESKPTAVHDFGKRSLKLFKRGEEEPLPAERPAWNWKARIGGVPVQLYVSEYLDGRPGQVTMFSAGEGSTMGALLDTIAKSVSNSLQRGVSLERIVRDLRNATYEPSGMVTEDRWIRSARSITDYFGKVLELNYLGNLEVAENKDGLDLKALRGYKSGAFKTYEMQKIDQWDFEEVLKHPELGGFTNGDSYQNNSQKETKLLGATTSSTGKLCNRCGFAMIPLKSNCWECTNCPESEGACG